MCEIPADLQTKLEARIRELVASEIRGDVPTVYDFTLPATRARRIAARDDEPELSLSSITEYVGLIHKAEVQSIHLERFDPSVQRYGGCSAALVVTTVRYNGSDSVSESRCIWVYSDETWFTTSLCKRAVAWPTNSSGAFGRS